MKRTKQQLSYPIKIIEIVFITIVHYYSGDMDVRVESKRLIQLAKLFLPFIIAVSGILVLQYTVGKASSAKLLLLMMVYFFPPLGKESIIPLGVS